MTIKHNIKYVGRIWDKLTSSGVKKRHIFAPFWRILMLKSY